MSSGNRQTSNYVSFSPWLQLTSGSTWEPARLCSPPWGRRPRPRPRRLRPSGRGPARVSPPRPACSCRAGRKGWRESAATPAPTTSRQTAEHTMLEDCHTGALSYPGDVGRQNISKHGEKVKCQKTCQWYEVFLRNEEVGVDSVHVWSIIKFFIVQFKYCRLTWQNCWEQRQRHKEDQENIDKLREAFFEDIPVG